MSIDLKGIIRRRKPEKRLTRLVPRERDQLADLSELPSGPPLVFLLDTTVYIHRAAGRMPGRLCEIIDQSLLFHCSVALGELAVGVANADPTRAGWSDMRAHYSELFAAIPVSRMVTPDDKIWAEAGVIAGTLARTQGYHPHQRKACLNDALIFLSAVKAGLPVLTANRGEFDLLQQIVREGAFVHYRSE